MLAIFLTMRNIHPLYFHSSYGPKFFYNNIQILDGLRATDDRLILIDMDERVKVVFILVFKLLMLFKKSDKKNGRDSHI